MLTACSYGAIVYIYLTLLYGAILSTPLQPVSVAQPDTEASENGESNGNVIDPVMLKHLYGHQFIDDASLDSYGKQYPSFYESPDMIEKRVPKYFIRYGRGPPKNFIRFGRSDPKGSMHDDEPMSSSQEKRGVADLNFLRFGRGNFKNFLRFGRSLSKQTTKCKNCEVNTGYNPTQKMMNKSGQKELREKRSVPAFYDDMLFMAPTPLSWIDNLGGYDAGTTGPITLNSNKRSRNRNSFVKYGRNPLDLQFLRFGKRTFDSSLIPDLENFPRETRTSKNFLRFG